MWICLPEAGSWRCVFPWRGVFFSLYDWNRILCLSYMGETEKEEKEFRQTLLEYGIRRESDLILTNFYPELKRQVMESWNRLFSHDQAIRKAISENQPLSGVQAGLWVHKKRVGHGPGLAPGPSPLSFYAVISPPTPLGRLQRGHLIFMEDHILDHVPGL